MCMRSVNATVTPYEEVIFSKDGLQVLACKNPFGTIIAEKSEDGLYSIGNFNVVTDINLLGTKNENNKADNVLERKGCMEVMILITKCEPSKQGLEKKSSALLDKFDVDTAKLPIDESCLPFLNYQRITNVGTVKLSAENALGDYVIKVVTKRKEDDDTAYRIQSLYRLTVKA